MEESGVTKLVSVRLEHEEVARADVEPPQQGLWDDGGSYEEEEVEPEEGRELPPGTDDPEKVTDSQLRPIRSGIKAGEEPQR
jgi:chromosome segregation protein